VLAAVRWLPEIPVERVAIAVAVDELEPRAAERTA
jgi:hypothetical protein